MPILKELNAKQREAVCHTEGPLLILAGAGAGKTKTITHRMLYLIQKGVAPHTILAVTFTNKAAREMRERIQHLISNDATLNLPIRVHEMPLVSTFHALGVHIIREHTDKLNLPKYFTIYDRSDSSRAIKTATTAVGLDPKQFEPRKILGTISRQKGNGIFLEGFRMHAGNQFYPRVVSSIWEAYEKILSREKALDFDDLLLKTVLLLKKDRALQNYYQEKWHYIHIDEYQDTNRVQYELASLLTGAHKNICVVGDVDQNIYSWRGADIAHILEFEKEFTGTKIIRLEQNYRSTKTIVETSNEIIKKNKRRKEKHLFTENAEGDKISLYVALDEEDEADFVARKTSELIAGGAAPECIAVLYRANFQSRVLEEMFLYYGLPYQIVGTRFFERKEIKDLLSFINAALNPESVSDVKRVINTPPRGIGKVTLLKVIEGKEETLSPAMKKRVDDFRTMLKDIAYTALTKAPSETIRFILKRTSLEETLQWGDDEDRERLENIRELVTLAQQYDGLEPRVGIEKLLEDAALASEQDEIKDEKSAVRLMTVHASKGLEFTYVFITGLEEGLFPHERLDTEDVDEEEERRLFYVALTRAEKKVYLSYAHVRTIFGSRQGNIPSEFITEIDGDILEVEESTGKREKMLYIE